MAQCARNKLSSHSMVITLSMEEKNIKTELCQHLALVGASNWLSSRICNFRLFWPRTGSVAITRRVLGTHPASRMRSRCARVTSGLVSALGALCSSSRQSHRQQLQPSSPTPTDIPDKMAEQKPKKIVTLAELKEHSNAKSCWLAIHDKVYDVTKFLEEVSEENVLRGP